MKKKYCVITFCCCDCLRFQDIYFLEDVNYKDFLKTYVDFKKYIYDDVVGSYCRIYNTDSGALIDELNLEEFL